MISIFQTFFGAAGDTCTLGGRSFLGFPHWYQYLKGEDDGAGTCSPVIHTLNEFWPVILSVAEILLRVAGLVALAYIIYAGFDYVTSSGESDKVAKARQKIINAIVGLIIVTIAATVVSFIGSRLSGGRTSLGLPDVTPDAGTVHDIFNTVFVILGSLSFLMIVLSGLLYVISQGDPSRTARARNTIIYSAVGLVVAILSSTIVNYVLKA